MTQTPVWTGVARRTLTESKLGHYLFFEFIALQRKVRFTANPILGK
jgi:hypothetical protein